jgi:HEPN domain-containing protein
MSDLEEAQAIRYYLDAMCDMDTIGLALSRELYPVAIFFSQQVCEKCAKGCLALSLDHDCNFRVMQQSHL